MATIKLAIVGDTRDVYKKIGELESYAKSMKPIQLKFSAVGFNEVSKNALALAKAQAQIEISANKAAAAEARARTASLAYGKQAETTRTQEARRAAETQKTATALVNLATQQERTRTSAQNYATQTEKTKAALAGLRGEQGKTATSTISFGNVFDKVWSRITSTIGRRLINQAFTALRSNIKETLNVMKAVDTQLINIQKVSGKTSQEIAAIGERAYDTAARYGVAVEDYLSAVYSFQKAGLGENAEELAELATKTMLVGDTTSAVAEKFLISSNAAWELHGNIAELNKVIDEADYINNNYATTLDKIAAGLPIVASVAANAGMSYSETMAALGTIQSITQESGTKSATALRALILNIEKEAGSYLTEDGEEFEVTEESIKGLQGLLEKYAKTEMDAARATGELINPMTAIKALFEGMRNEDLNENELFQLLSAMGGKLRTNQLTALVKNFDMFDQMLQQLGDSAGTADKEIELMMQAWEKKTQVLKDRWQQFIAGLVSTDEIKGLIDDITEFVTNLDPQQIGAAIRDTLYPIIDFIRNVDWAGAAQSISSIFDKIMSVAKGGAIAATAAIAIGGLQKIISFLGTIGGLLGIGGFAGAAAGGGIIGGLVLIGTLIKPLVDHAINVDRLTESADRLTKTVKEQSQQFADNKAEIDAAGTVVGIYIDRLEELEKQGLDTKEAQDEYQNILDQIVTIMPELSDAVEKANGQYEGFSKTLRDNADAWIENATAQAYKTEIESVASAKANAELENQRNINELAEVNKTLAVYDAITKEADELAARIENGDFANNDEWLAAKARLEELGQKTWELGGNADIQEALTRRAELEAAIAESEKKIENAKTELDAVIAAYEALNAEEEQKPTGRPEGYVSPADAWRAKEEAAKRAASSTQETTSATQEATQAEGEYAAAATNAGQAATQAATVTKESAQDTVNELQKVKEALDEIPEERGITLTPHFENALAAIQRYVHFLDYLKENYSSTLTSTITHDDKTNKRFYQETASGANGIPARATGDSNFPGGPTLVNELGPELISENGRAFIAGGGKPTVVNLAPGAIVIPADETRQALKGGMPRYGRAYSFIGNGTNQSGNPPIGAITTPSGILNQYRKAKARVTIETGGGGKGGGGTSSRGGSGSSSASNTITFNFPDLEKQLSDALKLLEAQVELAENEGDYPRMAELYEKAQESIKDLVDKYRQAGYSDDSIEVLTMLNKNYDYANKQLKLYQDKWDDLIDALSADTDATKAAKELEEKRLALEEATAAYENAQKQRTVRMYNASTGQWEWIADDKKVQSARDKVSSAEENYADTVKKQAIAELERMKETVTDLSDVVLGPALSAVATMAESSDEFQNFARALNAVFGVGSFLQSTEGTTKAISTVDSHDTTYSFGGVDISPEQASTMSLKDLAQMLQVLKIT